MRLGAIFVAICMVIIAVSAGAAIYFYFGVSVSEATTVTIATLTALAIYNAISTRIGVGAAAGHQLVDLARGTADLARQVAEMGRRLAAMEARVEAALDRTRAVTDPLTVEIGELGTLVKHLAETVAAHQTASTCCRARRLPRPACWPPRRWRSSSLPRRWRRLRRHHRPRPNLSPRRK